LRGFCGECVITDGSTFTHHGNVVASDSTHLAINIPNMGLVGSELDSLQVSPLRIYAFCTVPISGWYAGNTVLSGSGVSGTGTAGKLSVWSSSTAIAASSVISESTGRILIGATDNNVDKLQVSGSVGISGVLASSNFKRGVVKPESLVTGDVGDLFLQTPASSGSPVFAKFTGTGNTGWQPLGVAAYYASISSGTTISITGAVTATVNRMHTITAPLSADYTITMPTAVAGDVVGFNVKNYNEASKQFKLDAGGTVKIAGRTRYLVLLHTNVALLQYDGADWQPLVLNLDTPWVEAGVIDITAVTSNPTKGTTSNDVVYWRRIGKDLHQRVYYTQTANGTTGTGNYLFAIKIGTIDSTYVRISSATMADEVGILALSGNFRCRESGTSNPEPYQALPYDTTKFRLCDALGNAVGSALLDLNSAETSFCGTAYFPMTDW
jgi:hypothetical protein